MTAGSAIPAWSEHSNFLANIFNVFFNIYFYAYLYNPEEKKNISVRQQLLLENSAMLSFIIGSGVTIL